MKYFKFTSLIAIFFLYSCAEESDTPGTTAPTDDRSRFTGSWICAENTGQTFGVTISLTGVEDSIYINNFSNYGSSANALGLVSGNSLTIPGQSISVTSVFVQGSGVLNSAGTKITMNYVADGDTIIATCTKN
jgi:hypothetical protein